MTLPEIDPDKPRFSAPAVMFALALLHHRQDKTEEASRYFRKGVQLQEAWQSENAGKSLPRPHSWQELSRGRLLMLECEKAGIQPNK